MPWGDGLRAGSAGRVIGTLRRNQGPPVRRPHLVAGGQQPMPVRLRPTLPIPVAPGRSQPALGEHPTREHGRGLVEHVVQDAAVQVLQLPFDSVVHHRSSLQSDVPAAHGVAAVLVVEIRVYDRNAHAYPLPCFPSGMTVPRSTNAATSAAL